MRVIKLVMMVIISTLFISGCCSNNEQTVKKEAIIEETVLYETIIYETII